MYGPQKLDGRLHRRLSGGHAVLGGPKVAGAARWLCTRCGAEFGREHELAGPERLEFLLEQVRGLAAIESDLKTAGLPDAADPVSRARRALVEAAREDAQDETSEQVMGSLQPRRRGDLWTEEETILAYDLLKRRQTFPVIADLTRLARQLGRSVGSVSRKLANLDAAEGERRRGLSHRSRTDEAVVRRFRAELRALRREARTIRRALGHDALPGARKAATRDLRFEFWTALNDLMEREGTTVRMPAPSRRHWQSVRLGRAGFSLNLTMSVRRERLGCELYISHKAAKRAYAQLEAERESLERELGVLDWQQLPGKRACRIVQYRALKPGKAHHVEDDLRWFKERVEAFHRVFAPRIRTLLL